MAERQTQLSLWSLASAPLIPGTDLTGELAGGQCLDTRGNGTPGPYVYFPGTAEQIWACNGQANQQWSWAYR